MDFAYPIEGYEAPYGKAQLVMVADLAVTRMCRRAPER